MKVEFGDNNKKTWKLATVYKGKTESRFDIGESGDIKGSNTTLFF